jgi:hypothetical protein
MTSSEGLNLVGLTLALVATVIALWQGYLIRRQLAHSQKTREVELYFRVAHSFWDLDVFFVDRPKLRPYFYENKKLPRNNVLLAQLSAASEMLVDLAECVIACAPGLGEMAVDWHKYFSFLYQNSAALRQYWHDYSYYYPDKVKEAFQAPAQSPTPTYMAGDNTEFPGKDLSLRRRRRLSGSDRG